MRDLRHHREALALNTATLGHRSPIEAVIDKCAAHGFGAIAPWRRDLEGRRLADVAARIRDRGLTVTGYCRSTYFTHASHAERQAAIDDNARAIDEAAAIGAASFVLVVGGVPDGMHDIAATRQQAIDGVGALLERARTVGVALAIEPIHPMGAAGRSVVNTLAQALDWCDALDPERQGGLGLMVDAYHVWWDPDLEAGIARACRDGRVLGYHVSDWLRDTRDLVTDRGMMGDGVIDLRRIRGLLEAAGYRGPVEVEIFSATDWWVRPEDEVLEFCMSRLLDVC
jgi:sugar phosphate isomerase/epimerase